MSLKSGYPGSWVEVILSHQELAEMLRSQAATANQDAASGGARCSAADWPRPANQRPARISARQPQPLGLGLGVHSLIWLQHHTRGCGAQLIVEMRSWGPVCPSELTSIHLFFLVH